MSLYDFGKSSKILENIFSTIFKTLDLHGPKKGAQKFNNKLIFGGAQTLRKSQTPQATMSTIQFFVQIALRDKQILSL